MNRNIFAHLLFDLIDISNAQFKALETSILTAITELEIPEAQIAFPLTDIARNQQGTQWSSGKTIEG